MVTSEEPLAGQAVAAALDEAGVGTSASGKMTSRATRVRHQLGA
jgi:hypothetical protein